MTLGLPPLPPDLHGLNARDFFEDVVARAPDREFLVTREGSLTYADAGERVEALAGAWAALGVTKGDRVAFMLDNSADFVCAWLALAALGGVLVGLNTRLTEREVAALAGVARPALGLAGPQYVDTLRAAASVDVHAMDDLLAHAAAERREAPRPTLVADDAISIIFTSGTTGRSKAVLQTHGNFVLTGQAYPTWLELDRGARLYGCLPLFHVNAQAYSTMGAIGAEGTLVLAERFSASRFWDDVHEHRPVAVNYIGAMIAILMEREPSELERGHTLKIAYGAPKFPQQQLEAIERRFGLTLVSGFGMSETTFGLVESLHDRRPGTVGRPRQHPDPRLVNQCRVVDDRGVDVPTGEVGELVFRSPMIMQGYFDEPELTAQAIRDGWLHTGDLGRVDTDGYFSFVDRKKDMVRRRGENISPLEVELALSEHPAIEEASVIGVPSELTDEEVLAFVVLASGRTVTPEELVAWCAQSLAEFKIPRYVQVVDALPKTETQKVDKNRLRREVAEPTAWLDLGVGTRR